MVHNRRISLRIACAEQCTQFVNNKNYFLFDRFMLFFCRFYLIVGFLLPFPREEHILCVCVRTTIWGTFCTITAGFHKLRVCVDSRSFCWCCCYCKWAYTIHFIIYLQQKRNSSGTKFYANSIVSRLQFIL